MRYGRVLIDNSVETPEGDTVSFRVDPVSLDLYMKLPNGVEKRVGGEPLNINVSQGRNFSSPSLFNQAHVYTSYAQFFSAFLAPALPPVATISGQFRINGSGSFIAFQTIEKGTVVNEVRLTLGGSIQPNSPLIKELNVVGGATPAQHIISPPDDIITGLISTHTVNNLPTDNSSRTYSVSSKDTTNVVGNSVSASYSFSSLIYHGVGTEIGVAITEDVIRGWSSQMSGHASSITKTPSGGQYIYYSAPVAYGLKVFEFLNSDQTNPESALRVKVRTASQIANGVAQDHASVDEYFVIRSISAGLGGGSPYTFSIGNIG